MPSAPSHQWETRCCVQRNSLLLPYMAACMHESRRDAPTPAVVRRRWTRGWSQTCGWRTRPPRSRRRGRPNQAPPATRPRASERAGTRVTVRVSSAKGVEAGRTRGGTRSGFRARAFAASAGERTGGEMAVVGTGMEGGGGGGYYAKEVAEEAGEKPAGGGGGGGGFYAKEVEEAVLETATVRLMPILYLLDQQVELRLGSRWVGGNIIHSHEDKEMWQEFSTAGSLRQLPRG